MSSYDFSELETAILNCMRRRLLTLLLVAPCLAVRAQSSWTDVHQPAVWLNTFVDHAITPRTSLWFDGHWRRMEGGASPQQLLLRPGVQLTLGPKLRIGGGYAYIATAPYGESPNAAPVREHRVWQQLSVSAPLGGVSFTHRFRLEQRWSGALDAAGELGPLSYQQRVRYLVRAQRPLGDGPLLGFVANEYFHPFGHSDGAQRRLQNRAQVGLGIPLDARQRLEVGYLHQWNRITPRRTHEFNHTLVASWVWTVR